MTWKGKLVKKSDFEFLIPQDYKPGMRVPGLIYASERLMEAIQADQSLEQVANVATLPGILKYSFAMPDIHWGYGFPIGGVAAMDWETGVVSPGGVGYDINCGVRLIRTNLTEEQIEPVREALANALYRNVPSGVGEEGHIRLTHSELDRVLENGVEEIKRMGMALEEDLEACEEYGKIPGASATKVSVRAKERGKNQLGTLGAGNHFLEVQKVEKVFRPDFAEKFGLFPGQVTIMIHCGSRGLGHQVCDDYLKVMREAIRKYNLSLPDPQLACTPIQSQEGRDYFAAMCAAANFAWANRQVITHFVRKAFEEVFKKSFADLGMVLVYDVAHNMAKREIHEVEGKKIEVCVHRKGATRAFPPGRKEIPEKYRDIGQPVLIPGNMGSASYCLIGTKEAMEESFGSTCHGAGRVMSRSKAIHSLSGQEVAKKLEARGITVKAGSWKGIAEEAPEVYKDVDEVARVVDMVKISYRVARMVPLIVIKG
ncbi:MAG: RtcB family protein [bacterium JZ-2024 1]